LGAVGRWDRIQIEAGEGGVAKAGAPPPPTHTQARARPHTQAHMAYWPCPIHLIRTCVHG
jgi:hypothetical protein